MLQRLKPRRLRGLLLKYWLDQCDKLASAHMELDEAKQQALDHAATLYHQTDRNAADSILQSQTMRPGMPVMGESLVLAFISRRTVS